jgi:hypothetical protein
MRQGISSMSHPTTATALKFLACCSHKPPTDVAQALLPAVSRLFSTPVSAVAQCLSEASA